MVKTKNVILKFLDSPKIAATGFKYCIRIKTTATFAIVTSWSIYLFDP